MTPTAPPPIPAKSPHPQLSAAVGTRYALVEEIPGGGSAVLFKAWDTQQSALVAIKALRHAPQDDGQRERFRREVKLLKGMDHKHIVRLLDAGDLDDIAWFVMPFAEGGSLHTCLSRGRLPIDEVLRILNSLASALVYAGERGVLHRDIKPANVLVHKGEFMLADFGIAKLLAVAGSDSHYPLTEEGMGIGTCDYMSPEQIHGAVNIDSRTDVYSFGVLAYEILAGKRPFVGPTSTAVVAAHLAGKPRPILQLRQDIPPQLAALVMSCIAMDPERRPANAVVLSRTLGKFDENGKRKPSKWTWAPVNRAERIAYVFLGAAILFAVTIVLRSL